MSFQELQEVPGIGKVKAIELLAAMELGETNPDLSSD